MVSVLGRRVKRFLQQPGTADLSPYQRLLPEIAAGDYRTPADLAATVLWRFGLDWRHEIHDPLGRPMPLSEGSPIKGLFLSAA